jgi:hypothetical protein
MKKLPVLALAGGLALSGAITTTASAALQRYVGTAWTTVGSVQFTNGLGNGYVRSTTTPGRVSYRYYVPTATVAGGTYLAAYSPTFVLTTT